MTRYVMICFLFLTVFAMFEAATGGGYASAAHQGQMRTQVARAAAVCGCAWCISSLAGALCDAASHDASVMRGETHTWGDTHTCNADAFCDATSRICKGVCVVIR
jgi:hypothetical protein